MIKQPLIAIDQFLNTLLGGWADETVSARAFRLAGSKYRWYLVMRFINLMFFWQADHCLKSFVSEQERRHLPTAYRDDLIQLTLDKEFHNPIPQILKSFLGFFKKLFAKEA